jgi:hypothetical protein
MTAFGQPICHVCGIAPEIYDLHAGSWNDDFVSNASDREIHDFLRTMKSGERDAKKKAVQGVTQMSF